MGIVAGHQNVQPYKPPNGVFPRDTLEENYEPARKYGKELWETEISLIGGKPDYGMFMALETGLLIYNAMAKAEVNTYVLWVFLNSWRDNEGLADLTVKTYKISKRLYAFGNWSNLYVLVML